MKKFLLIGLVMVIVSTLLPLTIEAHRLIMGASILWWIGGEVIEFFDRCQEKRIEKLLNF